MAFVRDIRSVTAPRPQSRGGELPAVDAILFDVMTCGQPYSYYCNKALDDLVIQGRSTLDSKKRMEIYAKAQRLIHDDAAYLFKWGLRGVWGISNRIEYEAPRDEVDRMFVVTPRKK